jgi:hypothetical protein
MGDLNGVPNPKLDRIPHKTSNTPEHSLLKLLKSLQYYDTYRLFYLSTSIFSYTHNNSHSRIDQIWTNVHITLLDFADILPNPFTSSDHSIVSLELTINLPKINTQLLQTRIIYQWKITEEQQIENYQNHTEQNLQKLLIPITNITNSSELNTT